MLVTLLALLGSAPAGAAPAPAFRIADARITEASGIAAGIASPGVVYVHNDSGDSARFFALDARTGATLATYDVPGAGNVDWEDIAVARDRRGVPSVWLADIGDNDAVRAEVRIYRVDEPHVDRSRTGVTLASPAPDVWRLRYPDGARDAESLAVAPGGAAYVFSKSLAGSTRVYVVPSAPDPGRSQLLHVIGTVQFTLTGTPGGPNVIGELTATGAALSADGSVLVVRTYTDAYLWPVGAGGLASAIRAEPRRLALPEQPQGEGITIGDGRLLIDSEGAGSVVYALALPAISRSSMPSTSSRKSAPSATATSSVAPGASARPRDRGQVALAVGGGVLVLVAAVGLRRRWRRAHSPP